MNFVSKIFLKEALKYNINIDNYIEKLDLKDDINKHFAECSFGTKQKIFILGSLISKCNNIILDEPFNGLDPIVSDNLRKILKSKALEGTTILFSSHSLDLISNFSDIILFLADGKIHPYENENYDYKQLHSIFLRMGNS